MKYFQLNKMRKKSNLPHNLLYTQGQHLGEIISFVLVFDEENSIFALRERGLGGARAVQVGGPNYKHSEAMLLYLSSKHRQITPQGASL
jgi:hypothetical protein